MVLDDQIRLAILAHARNSLPDECCGLLAAEEGTICFAYPLSNADASPVSFTIDPDEHFGALHHAESRGWEITGVFHSHPGGDPVPSATDIAMAFDPDWVHLIAADDEIAAFRIDGGRIEELPVWVVVKESPAGAP
jgi:proteasome lid subunit RPN8/RPN11